MYVIGIDIGSVTTKGVLYDGQDYYSIYRPTGSDPTSIGDETINDLCSKYNVNLSQISSIYGTGYGRVHLPAANKVFSEIICQGRACNYLFPSHKSVLDVGGQDSKALLLDDRGKVRDFVLNDKCAAGTGRFLEMSLNSLGLKLDQIDEYADTENPVEIGSMCSVFCETEVLNLMMQGEDKGRIVAGLLKSIATRVSTMIQKVNTSQKIVFTGGVSKSTALQKYIQEQSGCEVTVPREPFVTAALGAAVMGYETKLKEMQKEADC